MNNIKKHLKLSKQITFEDEIISFLIRLHAFAENDHMGSFCRKGQDYTLIYSRTVPNSKAPLQHLQMT